MKLVCSLLGNLVILIPYSKNHVLKYHEWMQDPYLLESTNSEKVSTLEQQYKIQKQWESDQLKGAFIIMEKRPTEGDKSDVKEGKTKKTSVIKTELCFPSSSPSSIRTYPTNEGGRMAGDVNFFLSPHFRETR
eukprot:jgi/Bigna1/127097/aug1.3_g1805